MTQPTSFFLEVFDRDELSCAGAPVATAKVKFLWDVAPKTCRAIADQFADKTKSEVMICHARHSGGEALFITPDVLKVGDENTILDYKVGDFVFGFEPQYITI